MIGIVCAFFHTEGKGFYSKNYRRKGYCEEACKAVIKQIFGEGLSVDHNQITVDRLYATTLAENTPTVELLKRLDFTEIIQKMIRF